jgi:thiamine monophosphate synthase
VIASGAAAVAVITDLLTSGDPETRARHYLRVLA